MARNDTLPAHADKDSKLEALTVGLSKTVPGKDVPMAGSKDAYSPLIGGVANGRPLTRDGAKKGIRDVDVQD
jgi:hypothetical protein